MKYIPAIGPDDASIMIVGEAPGFNETQEGKPFVGQAGQVLRRFLMSVGIDPEGVWLTNICKYQPPQNDLSRFFSEGGIPNQYVLQGLVELEEEIKRVKPNIIIAAGSYAMWALTGKGGWNKKEGRMMGVMTHRGSIYPCTLVDGVKVMPTFHPSYIAREGMGDHGAWVADLERAKRESAFPEIRRPKKELIIDPRGGERDRERDWLLSDMSKIMTIDIEYINTTLLCVGLTTHRDRAVVFRTQNSSDIRYIKDILLSGIGLNAQNAAFEVSILDWHYGMPIMPFVKFDTMLAAHAANPELPKDLGYLVSIYTDQPYHKDMVNWNLIKQGKQSTDVVWQYNAIDTWTEHEIMEEQILYDLNDEDVRRVFDHEMMLLPVLWDMGKRGIKVDLESIAAFRRTLMGDPEKGLSGEIQRMQNVLNMFAGKEVNVKGKKDLWDLLFGKLGLPIIKSTKTGPATDDKTMAALDLKATTDAQKTVIQLIRDIRKRRDLVSKFLDISFDEDGRLRGHYNPGGTDTGRLSSSKFYPTNTGTNQQNIPRDKRIRSFFIADSGYEFAYADLERAESLVVAHLTNDPRMLADHAPGTDAHRSLGTMLFDKSQEDITDDERYLAKKTRHAGNYMQGPMTFMKNVNQESAKTGVSIDFSEAKRFINIYRDIHPFLKKWWNETEAELWRTRKLYNLLGRPRTFFGHIRSIVPNAVAYVPQSTVGDVLNVGLLSVSGVPAPYIQKLGIWDRYEQDARELKDLGFMPLNQVHDAIGYQYPIANRVEVNTRVRRLLAIPLMIQRRFEEFTIPVEIQIGKSWGELKLWKEDIEANESNLPHLPV